MHILLIDHKASSRTILRHLIKCVDSKVRITEFGCPDEALDWCAHHCDRPDAVIIDTNHLPSDSMHGLEFANHFRLQPEHRDVPVLLMTMDGDVAARRAVITSGIAEVHLKPTRARDLIERLTHVHQDRARKKQGHAPPASPPHPSATWLVKSLEAAWKEAQPTHRLNDHGKHPSHAHRTHHTTHASTPSHHPRSSHRSEHTPSLHARSAHAHSEHAQPKAKVVPLRRGQSKADSGDHGC